VPEINNYIPISRKIFEHQFWCEDRVYSRFEAWIDIVQSTRFEDTEFLSVNRRIEVKRGQLPVSLRYLAERWKWSTKKVNNFINVLILAHMVTKETLKETGQTILTICNYNRYNFDFEEWKQEKKRKGNGNKTGGEGNSKETLRKQQGNKYNKDNNLKTKLESSYEDSLSGGKPPDAPSSMDYKKFVDWFNAETKGVFGMIRYPLGEKRKDSIRARVREYGKESLFEAIKKAYESDFLKGDNQRGFKATLDWIINQSNFDKILSGNYDNRLKNGTKQTNDKTGGSRTSPEQLADAIANGFARAEFDKAKREG